MGNKKPKWDGKSRVSNETYRKRFDEIDWKKEWQGMPEFKMEDLSSFRKIVVHFRNQEDIDKFAELIGQKITKAPSLWYPEWKKRRYADKRYVDES
jgi:exonuclease I